MSQKDRRELGTLPVRIEKLEAEEKQLTDQLGSGDFYQRPAAQIVTVQRRLHTVQEELAAAYARWQELEAQTSVTM